MSSATDDDQEITADSKTLVFGDGGSFRPCGCITRKQKQINQRFFHCRSKFVLGCVSVVYIAKGSVMFAKI